jgi:PHS family inorganic phosphate transporter-like MFS transporter
MSEVVPMLGYIYFNDTGNSVPTTQGGVIKGGLSLGMILGQLTFGFLGDALGRHKIYGRELLFTMFGTLMCVLLPWEGLGNNGIVAWMAIWRVVTGFGIGGGM